MANFTALINIMNSSKWYSYLFICLLCFTACRNTKRTESQITSVQEQMVPGNPSGLNPESFATYWTEESASPESQLRFLGKDTIEIQAPKGYTLWRNEKISGDCQIDYYARVMDEGLPEDRLSDLNCFWKASDPQAPDHIFERKDWRQGIFEHYYSLQLYYLGYGGNSNSTTRFRRYDGDFSSFQSKKIRPEVLVEYTDSLHLLKPNHWYHIRIVCQGNRVQYFMDNELIVDFEDPSPLLTGWFGFRTTQARVQLTGFTYEN